MASDRLYELVFAYKKTKLWDNMFEDDIFAVKFSDGEIGYISIMGRMEGYCALGVYVGEEGIQSYLKIKQNKYEIGESFFMEQELYLSQNCMHVLLTEKDELSPEELKEARAYAKAHGIRFRGENAYPKFVKFEPNKMPWHRLSEKDEMYLKETLEVVTENVEKLEDYVMENDLPLDGSILVLFEKTESGYNISSVERPAIKEEEYPKPAPLDEFTLSSVKRIKKKIVYECEVIRFPAPVQENPEDAPYFPAMLLVVSHSDGTALEVAPVEGAEYNPDQLLHELVEAFKNARRSPKKLLVRNKRTFALLEDFGKQIGASVQMEDYLEEIEMIEDDMEMTFDPDSDDMEEEDFLEILEAMIEMPDEALALVPPEMVKELEMYLEAGFFADDIQKKAEKLLARIDSI